LNEHFKIDRLVEFTKLLRSEGFIVGMNEAADAIKLISEQNIPNKSHAEHVLRSVTCSSATDWQRFDKLFERYWFKKHQFEIEPEEFFEPATKNRAQQSAVTGFAGSSNEALDIVDESSELGGAGAGRQRTISKADFRFLNDSRAIREAEQMAEDLARILIKTGKRKKVISQNGDKLALRQTIRANLNYGGLPINKFYFSLKRIQPHVVILHDVSHSMSWNNPLLFRFARGLVRTFKNSEAFVFHTKLFPITSLYRERSISRMRDKLEAKNHLWLGGTCIAESLHTFNQRYAKKTLKTNSIVIVISDGFDTDSPEPLANELESIKRASRAILWLNPMIGREGYSMENQSLSLAKPYIKQFIAANSVDGLRECIHYIRDIN